MSETKNYFKELNSIDVSEHVEIKDTGKVKLSYLSWAWAWGELKKRYLTTEIISPKLHSSLFKGRNTKVINGKGSNIY